MHTGLRSLLRQDPEVIMIGEIRDPLTAEIAIQACLTGQLMLTTFHADSAATAVSRLLDMGIEPYLMRSGVIGILSQRLLRTLCPVRDRITRREMTFATCRLIFAKSRQVVLHATTRAIKVEC